MHRLTDTTHHVVIHVHGEHVTSHARGQTPPSDCLTESISFRIRFVSRRKAWTETWHVRNSHVQIVRYYYYYYYYY